MPQGWHHISVRVSGARIATMGFPTTLCGTIRFSDWFLFILPQLFYQDSIPVRCDIVQLGGWQKITFLPVQTASKPCSAGTALALARVASSAGSVRNSPRLLERASHHVPSRGQVASHSLLLNIMLIFTPWQRFSASRLYHPPSVACFCLSLFMVNVTARMSKVVGCSLGGPPWTKPYHRSAGRLACLEPSHVLISPKALALLGKLEIALDTTVRA